MTVVTEEEAKTMWCPHGFIAATNRHYKRGEGADLEGIATTCMSSNCMAWRWVKGNPVAGTGRGYCGLAGRP
jgi:hypothetical protein